MPHIKHIWKHTEIEVLIAAINQYGKNWAEIQRHYFSKLTVKSVRNMFYKIVKDDPTLLGTVIKFPEEEKRRMRTGRTADRSVFDKYPLDNLTNINMDDFTVHVELSILTCGE